jgi:transcriptional regulator with XRE-family HTH domain
MAGTFGDYLRQHRKRQGLSQGQLAHKAKISQSYVSGLERGMNRQPDRDNVLALADALGVPRQEALRAAGYAYAEPFDPQAQTAADPEIAFLVEAYREASPANRRLLNALAQEIRRVQRELGGGG